VARGYGAFSIGPASLEALKRYIDTQEEITGRARFSRSIESFLSDMVSTTTNGMFGVEGNNH
jgi:hypothetical protein